MDKLHSDYVEALKKCGESIVENAESIVGSEKLLTDVMVTIHLNYNESPRINIDRNFVPEGLRNT